MGEGRFERQRGGGIEPEKREARSVDRVHTIAKGVACVRERVEGN
jgi:hypothetical protein